MDEVQSVLEAWRIRTHHAGGKRTIACLKRALASMGIISSAAVAPGTPSLAAPDAKRFDEAFEEIRAMAASRIGEPWVSRVSAGTFSGARS
jgi:hypothetical protein